jgi:poly-gamma-glutamate capsule biosynthesis protein CapA/YwtB (metallophosphatase superfamily)
MAVNPPLASGAQGLERALAQFETAASRIASAGIDGQRAAPASETGASAQAGAGLAGADQAEALASLTLYAREVQAASKVVETADAVVGFLLDTRA